MKTKEAFSSNPVFDLGGTVTKTEISNYGVAVFILDDTSALIKKLDSLKNSVRIECSNATEARQHIKSLIHK